MRNSSDKKVINCESFKNGLAIKGSYSLSQAGFYVNLYLVNFSGSILATKSYSFVRAADPQEKMSTLLSALKQLCLAAKLDEITQPRIQEAASKSLLGVLTAEVVFKTAAA